MVPSLTNQTTLFLCSLALCLTGLQTGTDSLAYGQSLIVSNHLSDNDSFYSVRTYAERIVELKQIIEIEANNSSRKDLLEEIAAKADFGIAYNNELNFLNQQISFDNRLMTVGDALMLALEGTAYEPVISKTREIVLARKEIHELEPIEIETYQETVTGMVTDAQTGEALPGVNILIVGTDTGTITDADGNYELTVSDLNLNLRFTYIGYSSMEIEIDGRNQIDIELEMDILSGEELVVIGYGEQRRVNVIGSVSSIPSREITTSPVSSISNAIAGRLPGAIVQQRSGEPGFDGADILIRGRATLGDNAPLVVIDGIQGRDLNSLNPDDIESITVLKDASAAIYGARAANGVLLVTTKRGTYETMPTFDYRFYTGIQSPTMLPEFTDAATYATMIREMQSYRGVDESNMTFSLDDIAKYESGEYPWTHPNTNWTDVALADYSSTNHHNFGVGGGTENLIYYGSFGIQSSDGIYNNSALSYDRYNLRANLDVQVNDYINVGLDLSGSIENRMQPIRSSGDIYASIMRAKPTDHAIYPNGLPGPEAVRDQQPVITPTFELGFNDDRRYRSNNRLFGAFQVPGVEGLEISSYLAYDIYNLHRKQFENPWTVYDFDEDAYLSAGNTGMEDGSDFLFPTTVGPEPRLNEYRDNSTMTTFNLKADYITTINNMHNLSTFIAYESSEYEAEGIEAFRRYFVTDQLPYLFAGGDEEKDNSGWVNIDSQVNYFGRISYDYDETYLFQFSLRRDGSLRFSEESGRWGNFPSFLVGWRPSQHSWWQENLSFIDEFKLRASWGRMGNDLVPPFQYLASYGFGTGVILGENKSYYSGLSQTGAPNPFITWEVANVYNFGWESAFFDHRFGLDVDLFFERRSDILVQRDASVPNFTGISLPDENFGVVENRGFEVILRYQERQQNLSYGFSGNFSFARNRIVEYDEPERTVPWQVRTGNPMGSVLLYQAEGIFRDWDHVQSLPHVPGAQPGDIIISDITGDGEITPDDRILYTRTADPEITYGLSFNVGYRNWTLNGLIQGVGSTMRRMYSDARQGSAGNYYQHDAVDRWTSDNIDASKPRAFEREEEYWRRAYETDYAYVNAAFARLKNLQLSYVLPNSIQDVLRVRNAEIYFTGQNLFLIYSGNDVMDPELRGMNNYPLMRVLSLGANIQF